MCNFLDTDQFSHKYLERGYLCIYVKYKYIRIEKERKYRDI